MKPKVYIPIILLICGMIILLIAFYEQKADLTGKDELIDVESIPGKTIAVNKDDYYNAKPILSTSVSMQGGKTYLYRSEKTFFFVKAGEYVIIVTKDFDDTRAAGCELGNDGEYVLVANMAYKGQMTIDDGILKFISTRVL